MTDPKPHKKLTIADVHALGKTLIEVADMYPLSFVSEKHFFPLVVAYLSGRVPALEPEVETKGGRIDFHLKGSNPCLLELAVQSRRLQDVNCKEIYFASENARPLYAANNRTELTKLIKSTGARTRFLLLVDLQGNYDFATLKAGYVAAAARIAGSNSVRVVYVSRTSDESYHFCAKPKGRKPMKAKKVS